MVLVYKSTLSEPAANTSKHFLVNDSLRDMKHLTRGFIK